MYIEIMKNVLHNPWNTLSYNEVLRLRSIHSRFKRNDECGDDQGDEQYEEVIFEICYQESGEHAATAFLLDAGLLVFPKHIDDLKCGFRIRNPNQKGKKWYLVENQKKITNSKKEVVVYKIRSEKQFAYPLSLFDEESTRETILYSRKDGKLEKKRGVAAIGKGRILKLDKAGKIVINNPIIVSGVEVESGDFGSLAVDTQGRAFGMCICATKEKEAVVMPMKDIAEIIIEYTSKFILEE